MEGEEVYFEREGLKMIHKINDRELEQTNYYVVKNNTTNNVYYTVLREISSSNMDSTHNIGNHILDDLMTNICWNL